LNRTYSSAAGKYYNKSSSACRNHSFLSFTFSPSYSTQTELHLSDFRPTNPIASRAEQIEDCPANKYQSKHPCPQICTLPHSTISALSAQSSSTMQNVAQLYQ
jgi:hypothetical protein